LAYGFTYWLSFYFAGDNFNNHLSQQSIMTAEILNLNVFFSYFFVIGDTLFLFLGGAVIVGIIASLLEYLFAKE
jgi:hypothetical protein